MTENNNLKQLFSYDLWGNSRLKKVLVNEDSLKQSEKIQCLFAHIGAAQQIWYHRIEGKSTNKIELWPEHKTADASFQEIRNLHSKWMALIESNRGSFDRAITYKNLAGRDFETPFQGILQHLIIHGQHHRAQITAFLAQNSIEPPATDFIFYLRDTNNQ